MTRSFAPVTVAAAGLALFAVVGRLAAQPTAAAQPEPAHGETALPAVPPAAAAAGADPSPAAGPPAADGGGLGVPRPPAYVAVRATDPAAVERGRALYTTTYGCAACHAPDIRGTDRGNSLLRSVAVMQDAGGELIGRATRAVRAHGRRYPAIPDAHYADLAQFMKSFRNIGTGTVEIISPAVYQAGDPVAGQRYFAANCAACHAVVAGQPSPAKNLAGIGARAEPSGAAARNLQQRWLGPSTTKPVTGVVTLGTGQVLEGRVTKLDEFTIGMTLADGTALTVERNGPRPAVALTYPLAGHAALLRRLGDKDIHDVTGYLVSLK